MAKRVQLFRGTASVVAATIIKAGELMANLTDKSLHLGDGATPGGTELARADLNNVADATSGNAGKMTAAQATTVAAVSGLQAPDLLNRTALSGTAVDIDVPRWARKVILDYTGLGHNATSSPIIQLKSGTLKTSGYSGFGFDTNLGPLNGAAAGFSIGWGNLAYVHTGRLTLSLRRDDDSADYQWAGVLQGYRYDGVSAYYSVIGNYVLSGLTQAAIEQIRLTTVGGTASFDGTGYVFARFEF